MQHALTDDIVAALTPKPVGELIISDTVAKGLRLKVTPAGGKTWFFQYRAPDGRLRKYTLGSAAEISVKSARDLFGVIMARVREERDPHGEKMETARLVDAEPTLAVAWAQYDARFIARDVKTSTAHEYRRLWAKYVPAALKAKHLADTTKASDALEKRRRVGRADMQDLKDRRRLWQTTS